MIMQKAKNHNVRVQEKDSMASSQILDSIHPPPFSHFRKSFPTSCENQGSTYIKIVSPTVFTQALVETEGNPNGYYGLRGTCVEYMI